MDWVIIYTYIWLFLVGFTAYRGKPGQSDNERLINVIFTLLFSCPFVGRVLGWW